MEKEIHRLLCMGGVTPRYRYYHYFKKCVLQAVENPLRLQNICREVYLPVAQEFDKDIRAIEQGVRYARNLFIENGGSQILARMNGGSFWQNQFPYPSDMIEIFVFYLLDWEENKKKTEEIG